MKKILGVSLVIFLLLNFHFADGQVSPSAQTNINRMIPTPVPKSPNAASLGKFGDYDVSYYNGLPEISIPIFEAVSGDLRVPITLSYHASGVKPTDIASWVGMGWSLSAGGQVSRSVQGRSDEDPQGYYNSPLNLSPTVCGPSGTGDFNYLKDLVTNQKDGDPDIFSYSIPGKSGKFMLLNGQSPFLIPAAPIVINPYGIQKFDITDDAGVLYKFGTSLGSMETTNTTSGASIGAVSAWLLTDMISPNSNDQINFTYQPVGNATTHDLSYAYVVIDQCHLQNGPQTSATCPTDPTAPQQSDINSTVVQRGFQTITFESGKLEFALMASGRSDMSTLKALDYINIYSLVNNAYVLIKTVKFNYSYFTNAGGGNAALKLDEVHFKDNAGNVIQKYKFSYFTNSFSWNPAANYLHYRDWWGYYNGATQNTDLYPRQTIISENINGVQTPVTIGGAWDRNVNTQYVKEGVLKRIDFPTGGYTEFDFESNKYLNGSTPVLTGGLRVTKITSSDGSGTATIVKVYKYGVNESGYGFPKFSQNQFNYSATQYNYSDCLINGGAIVNYRVRSYHSNSAYSIEDSPVSYPVVTEYYGDPAIAIQGKTIYEYDNGVAIPDGVDQVVPNSGKFFKATYAWTRGFLTRKSIYDNANNPISETTTSYRLYQATNGKFVGVGAWQFVTGNYQECPALPPLNSTLCTNELGENVSSSTFLSTNYFQNSGVYLPSVETEKLYEKGTSKLVTSQTKRVFDGAMLQLLQSRTAKSTNDSIITVNRYPFQLAANASSTGNAKGIYMLNAKHILSSPVESYTYLVRGATENMVSAQVTTYRQHEGNLNYVVPDQIYFWAPSSQVVAKSSYAEMAINASNDGVTMDEDLKPRINMIRYSPEGDIQAVSKTNDAPVSYQYGYNKALPVAEVTNAQNTFYSFIQQSANSASITMSGPTPTVTTSRTFTVDYTGNVYLKLGVSGTPSYSTVATYSGITSGSVTLSVGACSITVVTFTNVAPGTYTINITLSTPDSGVSSLGACGEIVYPNNTTITGGSNEFLCENFEDLTPSPQIINSDLAHTGKQYYLGDYTASFTMPNPRTYLIEYWYLDSNNTWQYISKPYTGTSMVLPEGNAIDDVRIYPTDAQMKSYTYTPGLGITSIINESGQTYHYDYDSFGRLWKVRNAKGNIEKQYSYYYKGN